MDHIHHVGWAEHKHDLKIPPATALAAYAETFIAGVLGVGPASVVDDVLRFPWINAMEGRVLQVPIVPSKAEAHE